MGGGGGVYRKQTDAASRGLLHSRRAYILAYAPASEVRGQGHLVSLPTLALNKEAGKVGTSDEWMEGRERVW